MCMIEERARSIKLTGPEIPRTPIKIMDIVAHYRERDRRTPGIPGQPASLLDDLQTNFKKTKVGSS